MWIKSLSYVRVKVLEESKRLKFKQKKLCVLAQNKYLFSIKVFIKHRKPQNTQIVTISESLDFLWFEELFEFNEHFAMPSYQLF